MLEVPYWTKCSVYLYPSTFEQKTKSLNFFFLCEVSGPAYAHHDYSPQPTGHPASPGAGKAPRG